jgi:hypothetical protein
MLKPKRASAQPKAFDNKSEREIYVEVKTKILVETSYQETREREKKKGMVQHV